MSSNVTHLCFANDRSIRCFCGFRGVGNREEILSCVDCQECLEAVVRWGKQADQQLEYQRQRAE